MSYKNSKIPIEISIANDLDRFCPACEQFNNKFINELKGKNDQWRTDMDPIFEELGMADYAIKKSLCSIKAAIDNNSLNIDSVDTNQTFKNIYFHFGLILDNIEHLARHIVRLKRLLEIEDIKPTKTINELAKTFNKWLDKYEDKFYEYIETGNFDRPYLGMPCFCKLLLKSNFYSKYNSFARKLRDRRNTYAHNPSVGIFSKEGKLWTVEIEALRKNQRWTEMQANSHNNRQDFVDPHERALKDYEETLTILDKVWKSFSDHMDRLFNHQNFNKLLP